MEKNNFHLCFIPILSIYIYISITTNCDKLYAHYYIIPIKNCHSNTFTICESQYTLLAQASMIWMHFSRNICAPDNVSKYEFTFQIAIIDNTQMVRATSNYIYIYIYMSICLSISLVLLAYSLSVRKCLGHHNDNQTFATQSLCTTLHVLHILRYPVCHIYIY